VYEAFIDFPSTLLGCVGEVSRDSAALIWRMFAAYKAVNFFRLLIRIGKKHLSLSYTKYKFEY
jgi:hypothetical protein